MELSQLLWREVTLLIVNFNGKLLIVMCIKLKSFDSMTCQTNVGPSSKSVCCQPAKFVSWLVITGTAKFALISNALLCLNQIHSYLMFCFSSCPALKWLALNLERFLKWQPYTRRLFFCSTQLKYFTNLFCKWFHNNLSYNLLSIALDRSNLAPFPSSYDRDRRSPYFSQ